jgi:hypothetical protein
MLENTWKVIDYGSDVCRTTRRACSNLNWQMLESLVIILCLCTPINARVSRVILRFVIPLCRTSCKWHVSLCEWFHQHVASCLLSRPNLGCCCVVNPSWRSLFLTISHVSARVQLCFCRQYVLLKLF